MIERNAYLQKLVDRMNNGMIKVVTGVRRCGKSYLLLEIFYLTPYIFTSYINIFNLFFFNF